MAAEPQYGPDQKNLFAVKTCPSIQQAPTAISVNALRTERCSAEVLIIGTSASRLRRTGLKAAVIAGAAIVTRSAGAAAARAGLAAGAAASATDRRIALVGAAAAQA